jgi:NAD(P)-dependent dehydrogenase (short-subunit alcohol dehydrogenase family)
VALVGRSAAEESADRIRALGRRVVDIPADLSTVAPVRAIVEETVRELGGLDILVNNAGIFVGKGVEDASLDDWHRLVAVNLTGVVLGTRAALPHLKASGQNSPQGSAIVNLASVAGLVGSQLDPL